MDRRLSSPIGLDAPNARPPTSLPARAKRLRTSTGIDFTYETMISLAIYEAALGKGYVDGKSVWCEKPYPGDTPQNARRADLAFKDAGKMIAWAYIELKSFNNGKAPSIVQDIAKLSTITDRATKWIFVYRVASSSISKSKPLTKVLSSLSPNITHVLEGESFETIDDSDRPAICELCLAQVT